MTVHPTDRALAAYADGRGTDETGAHVRSCALCRARLASTGPAIELPDALGEAEANIGPVAQDSYSLPTPGDVWRLAWEDIRSLAVVIRDRDEQVTVVPLLIDAPHEADEWTLILAGDDTSLGFETGAAVAHPFDLPIFVFDARVGQLAEPALERLTAGVSDYRRGRRLTGATGPAVTGPLDDRVEAQGEVVDQFVALAEASWYEPVPAKPTDWRAVHRVRPFETSRLYELVLGARPTDEEVAAARDAGVDVPGVQFDPSLVTFLSRPPQPARLRRRAAERSRSEADLFMEAATELTTRRLALAARGASDEFDWNPLFEEFLDESRD